MGGQNSKEKNELSNINMPVYTENQIDGFVNITIKGSSQKTKSLNNSNNLCEKHTLKLNFFCRNENCFVPVCGDCLVLDHDKSTGHDVVNITDVLKSNILDDMKKTKQNDLSKIRSCITELEKQRDSQGTNKDFVTALINKKFEEYHELLYTRKKSLLEELENQTAEKSRKLQAEVKISQLLAHSLSKSLRTFSTARKEHDIPAIFKTYSDLKGVDLTERYMSHYDLLDLLTFATTNGNEFEQAVMNVGEAKEEIWRI